MEPADVLVDLAAGVAAEHDVELRGTGRAVRTVSRHRKPPEATRRDAEPTVAAAGRSPGRSRAVHPRQAPEVVVGTRRGRECPTHTAAATARSPVGDRGPSPRVSAYDRGVDTSLRQTLHRRGLRMTPQRQLVVDAVRALGHATPEQICTRVQETAPAVNITTIYRTLELLERIGLVRHTHLGHGAPTYSEQEHQHVHLVCHHCGSVAEAPTDLMDQLAARLRDESGFTLDATHVALSGRCADCAEDADADPTDSTEQETDR